MAEPLIQVRNMTELSPYKQKKVCEHEPRCDKFILINTLSEGMTLCQKDALGYCYSIMGKLGVLPEVKVKNPSGWDQEKLLFLINYIRVNDIRYGTYSELADTLGLSRRQIKDKVLYLRKKGAF